MSPRPKRPAELLTDRQKQMMIEDQGGVCAICGRPPGTRQLNIDHDHRTGLVRGLVCHVCNRRLRTDADAAWCRLAADYLERPAPLFDGAALNIRRLRARVRP